MRVDTAAIPDETKSMLVSALMGLVDEMFSDPATEAEYQAWKKGESHEVQNLPGLRSIS